MKEAGCIVLILLICISFLASLVYTKTIVTDEFEGKTIELKSDKRLLFRVDRADSLISLWLLATRAELDGTLIVTKPDDARYVGFTYENNLATLNWQRDDGTGYSWNLSKGDLEPKSGWKAGLFQLWTMRIKAVEVVAE